MNEDISVSVRLVKVAVNCGDHGQDIVRTVEVRPDETLSEVAARLLGAFSQWTSPDYDWRLEVQLVEPAPQRAEPVVDDMDPF